MAYPDAVKQRARELHQQGRSLAQIAQELGVSSRTTVRVWLLPAKSTAQHSTARPEGKSSGHGQSKSKAQEELAAAQAALLHELVALTEERPADAGPVDQEKLAARLDALVEDLITAARKQIPFADLRQVSGAIKVGVEMARLLRNKATSIIDGSIAVTGEEGQRELGGRIDAISARLEERARSAGIQGVVPGGAGGQDGSPASGVG